jgi:hypothetical protein
MEIRQGWRVIAREAKDARYLHNCLSLIELTKLALLPSQP